MKTNKNPHTKIIDKEIIKTIESIRRLDKDGYLYFMENSYDYYHNKEILNAIISFEQATKKWVNTTFVDACSAFCTKDLEGNMLTGRAYDFGHHSKSNPNFGMNIMIHTNKNPKFGIKYETIAATDACLAMASVTGGAKLQNGTLDDGKTDLSITAMLPFYITDGINEKGLTVSILLLPLDNLIKNKKKEPKAWVIKKSNCVTEMSIPRALRYILDNCETVSQAEEMLKNIWFIRFSGNNSHIFVTDRFGNSRLFEWYMDKENADKQLFASIKTNCATNFYQAFSKIPKGMPFLTNLKTQYSYGFSKDGCYRNTYDRFNTIVSMLDFYTKDKPKPGEINQAEMKEQTVDALVRTLALYPAPSSPTHQTQFSAIFNAKDLTYKIYSFANLQTSWTYSIKEHRFIKGDK